MTSYRILIVEDEGLIALDIAGRVQTLGHTVAGTASTADEALTWASGADVVLMDIRLDGPIDGIDAAALIRERYRLPVIFLTAHADRSTLERAKLACPYGYLVKPVPSASLQTTIEIALHNHRAGRQVEESEACLRATVSSAAEAIIATDTQGSIRTLNPAAVKLFEKNPQAETPAAMGNLAAIGNLAALAILEDGPVAIEAHLGECDLEGCAAPVRSANEVIGAVITLHDVSSLRRKEARTRQRERGETAARLAGGLAGDYASLVAIIRTQSEQLLHQLGDYSPARLAIEEIQQAATAADRLTRRLAGVAETGEGPLQILSLHGILRRMARLIDSIAGEHGVVEMQMHAATGKIHADATRTEEVLMRLVVHAANAMATGGRMIIETADTEDAVVLSVTHDGAPGTSAPFDLSVTRYLADEDGHRLEAFFPRWSEPVPAAGATPTLLLIEPRPHIRARLHNFFEANGYNLLEAEDEDQARTLLELQEVDLVIAQTADIAGISSENIPVIAMPIPYTQQQLLEQVRTVLAQSVTFSAADL
jgi:hypothetical protein